MPCTVSAALAMPTLTASSKLVGDSALISMVLATDMATSWGEWPAGTVNPAPGDLPGAEPARARGRRRQITCCCSRPVSKNVSR